MSARSQDHRIPEDDSVAWRVPRHKVPELKLPSYRLATLDVVVARDEHQNHHLKEKGYVERPACGDHGCRVADRWRSNGVHPFAPQAVMR